MNEANRNYDNVGKEYDQYQRISVLSTIGQETFGDEYVKQESSLTPSYLLDLAQRIGINSSHVVLDGGCGKGGLSLCLANSMHCRVIGIDVSEESVHSALVTSVVSGSGQSHFAVGSLEAPPFKDNTFNLVLAMGSLYWCQSDPEQVADGFRRILRDGEVGAVAIGITRIDYDFNETSGLQRGLFRPFIKWEEVLEHRGFEVEVQNITSQFNQWLLRWNAAIGRHKEELLAEMGEKLGKVFIDKFIKMEDYNKTGRLKRIEIIAHKKYE